MTVPGTITPIGDPTEALWRALRQCDSTSVRVALSNGADADALDCADADRTPLHAAAAQRTEECLVALLSDGRRPHLRADRFGKTAFHDCASNASRAAPLMLLVAAYGLSRATDADGQTFLHYLVRNTRIPGGGLSGLLRWLAECVGAGELLRAVSGNGESALDAALRVRGASPLVAAALIACGALRAVDIRAAQRIRLERREADTRADALAAERRHWRRVRREWRSDRTAHRARVGVAEREAERRRRLWLREHKARAALGEMAAADCRQVLEAAFRQRAAAAAAMPPRLVAREEQRPMTAPKEGTAPLTSGRAMQAEVKVTAAARIWLAYVSYRRRVARTRATVHWIDDITAAMTEAVTRIQACLRGWSGQRRFRRFRAALVRLQCVWRARLQERCVAVDMMRSALDAHDAHRRMRQFLMEGTPLLVRERIRGVMCAVTQLLWRENFCAALREIAFRRRRERPPPAPPKERRFWILRRAAVRWCLLAQFILALFMLIFIAATSQPVYHWNVRGIDLAVGIVLLLLQFAMPLVLWRVTDVCIIAATIASAAAGERQGVCTITLLTLKLPFVVRFFAPSNSGTRTYCRAIEQAGWHFLLVAPFGIAGIGAAVRGTALDDRLLTHSGNCGAVFLALWSTLAPQYRLEFLDSDIYYNDSQISLPAIMRMSSESYGENGHFLHRERTPLAQSVVFYVTLLVWTWSAVAVAVHDATRRHYELSDETKLRTETNRFLNTRKRNTLEAHRATDMRALARQVDGRLWEADVRAAKEAIDASHYDHKAGHTVHRFVRKVQDSAVSGDMDIGRLTRGGASMFTAPITAEWGKWDCRNEDPESRFKYDVFIIETALGLRERLTFTEKLVRRQWTSPIDKRESSIVVLAVLVLAAAVPNLYWMELAFSILFTFELLFSFWCLRVEFFFYHYMRLIIRLFCVVVGYVPGAIPFAVLRCFRLLEGWSHTFPIDGMTRYGFLYLMMSFITMWMITFVAMWQFHHETEHSMCKDRANCLALSLREMVLPAWTPTHIDTYTEAPISCVVIIVFRLFFVPFAAAIAMHPLMQLSGFIGRFLRIVVQHLHRDVVDYINSYIEGPAWFSHWRLRCGLPASTVTKLRMWVYDFRRHARAGRAKNGMEMNNASPVSSAESSTFGWERGGRCLWSSFRATNKSYITPFIRDWDGEEAVSAAAAAAAGGGGSGGAAGREESILSQAEFAAFAENELYHNPKLSKHRTLMRLAHLLRFLPFHLVNAALTLASIAFLWVNDASSRRHEVLAIVGIIIHTLSMLVSIILIPRDASGLLTFVSVGTLTAALALHYGGHGVTTRSFFCLRFVSLLRLGQLQVSFMARVRSFARLFIMSWIDVLFPMIIIGGVAYVVELMRAQVYLVHFYTPGKELDGNASFPHILASHVRRHKSYPNGEDSRSLFAYFFREDAYIFYSIFNIWLLPACSMATAMAYLRWTNTNLLDSQCLVINSIHLLEDPMSLARFRAGGRYVRYAGHAVLILSLAFGLLVSPATDASADDHRLFFALETVFAILGCGDSFLRLCFAVHRCGRSWAAFASVPRSLVDAGIPLANTTLLLAEVVQLLYWSCALPLAFTLLVERGSCLIHPNTYAIYFITIRFALLLRMLPRQYVLSVVMRGDVFMYAGACVVVYFVAAASALADVHVAANSEASYTRALWLTAARDLLRQTFTSAAPSAVGGRWIPDDSARRLQDLLASNITGVIVTSSYTAAPMLLALAVVGKFLLAATLGLAFGVFFVPLRPLIFGTLPRGAGFLYHTLCGGPKRIVEVGARLHDDMRPDDRRRVQRRKFGRMFRTRGIPMWLLPHLLEEIGMCKPGQQRRLMFALEQLFVFLPVAEKRARCVAEYVEAWDCFSSGGPGRLSFDELPIYPPRETGGAGRYVTPLRLVQAIALFESDFPPHSSVGSKLWLEFFKVSQRARGATLMQSLWRMYATVKAFEAKRQGNSLEVVMAREVRRAFRRNRIHARATFLSRDTFEEAVRQQSNIFNPGTGHYEVLNRLRLHYGTLQPAKHMRLRNFLVLSPLRSSYDTVTSRRRNPLRRTPSTREGEADTTDETVLQRINAYEMDTTADEWSFRNDHL